MPMAQNLGRVRVRGSGKRPAHDAFPKKKPIERELENQNGFAKNGAHLPGT